MESHSVGYLEGRRLIKRWNGPVPALVSLVLTLAVFYVTSSRTPGASCACTRPSWATCTPAGG